MMRSSMRAALLATLAATACGPTVGQDDPDAAVPGPDAADAAPQPDAAGQPDAAVNPGPSGFIGSPCETAADCDYPDAVCLTDADGFPGGSCSQACDLFCPDQAGHPVTFCVERAELPPAGQALGDGACLSRCDMGLFPDGGCRPGYGCVQVARANEPGTINYACLPHRTSELTQCHLDLAARGVAFEPTVRADDSPASHPSLTCTIEDPVWVLSPLLGVQLSNTGGGETERILAACPMAHALADTVEDVQPLGVVGLRHIGTYNCRVISGTNTLSQHAFANAIDIYGFDFDDGALVTLIDHWEHNTTNPQSPEAIFLHDASQRWHTNWIWNVILTPNFNAAHDNHFHVDLTEGSHSISFTDGGSLWLPPRYLGPAPYSD